MPKSIPFFLRHVGDDGLNTLREIALSLTRAGFGSMEFWLSRPVVILGGWLKLVDKILKRRKINRSS